MLADNNSRYHTMGSLAHLRALYAVSAAAIAGCVLSWFTIDRLKYPVHAYLQDGGTIAGLPGLAFGLLATTDYFLLASMVLLLGAVVVWELRARELSRGLVLDSRTAVGLLLGALLVWFAHSYLVPGYLLSGDAGSHIARVAHMRMGLEEGRWIAWDNYFYIGETAMQFTGPLYFWATAVVDLFVRDASLATKLMLFALHIASGVAMYRLLREWRLGPFAALIGALAYGGSFAHLHVLMRESAYPQAVTFLLLPLALLFTERVLRQEALWTPAWLGLSLTLAALLVNHQTTGAHAGVFVGLYATGSLVLRRAPWQRLGALAIAAGVAALISLFAIVPILAEKHAVMMYDHPESVFRIEWPGAEYFKLLLRWNMGDVRQQPAIYVGLSVIALAAFGAMRALRGKGDDGRAVAMLLVAGLVLSVLLRGAHVRHIIATLFFCAALAAVGTQALVVRWPARNRAALSILLLLLLDLGPTAVQPLARTDKAYFAAGGQYLAREAKTERVILTQSYGGQLEASIGPGGSPLLYERVAYLKGAHNLAATLSHNYLAAVIKRTETDLRERGGLSTQTRAWLAQFNVGWIVNDTGRALGLPETTAGAVEQGPLGRAIRLPNAAPAVFAPALTTVVPPPGIDKPVLWNSDFREADPQSQAQRINRFLDETLARTGFVPQRALARVLPVRGTVTPVGAEPGSQMINPRTQLLHYTVSLDRAALTLMAEQAGYAQLSHPWYPTVTVMRNGKAVVPWQGTLNFLVVPVSKGLNRYEIEYPRSTLRRVLNGFSAGIAIFPMAMVVISHRRRRRGPAGGS